MPPEHNTHFDTYFFYVMDMILKPVANIQPPKITIANIDFDDGCYKVFSPSLKQIKATGKLVWGCFMNNKKARLRKQQIMKSVPKKTDARCYLKWLEAKGTYGQMPFSWMAYWYRRLEHEH